MKELALSLFEFETPASPILIFFNVDHFPFFYSCIIYFIFQDDDDNTDNFYYYYYTILNCRIKLILHFKVLPTFYSCEKAAKTLLSYLLSLVLVETFFTCWGIDVSLMIFSFVHTVPTRRQWNHTAEFFQPIFRSSANN